MSRPQKHTVDYFAHDADASQGKTLSILFNHFGHEGISAWWQLLEQISKTENHVIGIGNPEELEYLAATMRFQPARLKEILSKMADLQAIDKELLNAGMIWSQNFVGRLEPVYKVRKQSLPTRPELSGTKTALSVSETELSIPENPQSKVKESKVKETIVNKTKREKGSEGEARRVFGEFQNVYLSSDEYDKLVKRLGEDSARDLIERLGAYMKSRRKKYDSHYATILNWARDDTAKGKLGTQKSAPGGDNGRVQTARGIPGNRPAGAFDDLEA